MSIDGASGQDVAGTQPRPREHAMLTEVRRGLRRVVRGMPARFRSPGQTRRGRQGRQRDALLAYSRYTRAYFQRWLLIGALIGVVAGVGAIVFYAAIALVTHLLLNMVVGYFPPAAASEGQAVITPIAHRWLIPVITTLGGLVSGVIVFSLAPEAEGHGTDAAIEAFHEKNGRIRSRIPLVKLVASAITIGSGGSAGREGPTAQISAGFGSWLGTLLHLDDHDRRIAMAAGIGSGIGAIFKAPFGGALLSAEILYKRDFEADVIFPTFVASVVGFSIYGAWAGWAPVFGVGGHFSFQHPLALVGYLLLGILAGLVGLLYPKTLYFIRDQFKRIAIPNHFKPAIGGLMVGLIGLFLPQAIGTGYGYVQLGINGDFTHLAAWLMFVLVFAKIVTTSLTIGSGGSGGVFGPGIVIGGFLGASVWAGLHSVAPGLVAGADAGAFAVVGMGAFFGGIAKAPLAVILMVAEMTGEYSLVVPAMLATMVAYLVTGDTSIYENQVPTRLDSPAHKDDYQLPLLQNMKVGDAMLSGVEGALATAQPDTPVKEIARAFHGGRVMSVPVIDNGVIAGVITPVDIARVPAEDIDSGVARARQVMSRLIYKAYVDETLYAAWMRMSRRGLHQLVVVDRAAPTRLVGVVTADSIGQVLRLPAAQRGDNGAASRSTGTEKVQKVPASVTRKAIEAAASNPPEGSLPGNDAESAGSRSPAQTGPHAEAAMAQLSRTSVGSDPFTRMRVAEAMQRDPVTISISAPLSSVRQVLRQQKAVLAVDEDGTLAGIITQRDLTGREDVENGRVLTARDVAVRNVVIAQPTETLRAAVRRMTRSSLRQLPVVEGPIPSKPVGLIRRSDVLAAYGKIVIDETAPTASRT